MGMGARPIQGKICSHAPRENFAYFGLSGKKPLVFTLS
jgi:hypothetical protein